MNSNFVRLRKAAGFDTQEQLAQHLKLDRSTVAKWESGKAQPRVTKLRALATALDCTVDDLLSDSDEKTTG